MLCSCVKLLPNKIFTVRGVGKVKSASYQVAHTAGAYPGFRSIKRLRVFYFYSPLDGIQVHRRVTPQHYLHLSGKKQYEREVSCLRTQRSAPARARTRTVRSLVLRASLWATTPPSRDVARIFPWGGPKYRFQNLGKCCVTNIIYLCPGSKTFILIYTCLDIVDCFSLCCYSFRICKEKMEVAVATTIVNFPYHSDKKSANKRRRGCSVAKTSMMASMSIVDDLF